MTRTCGRPNGRLFGWMRVVALVSLGALTVAPCTDAAAKRKPAAKSAMTRVAKPPPVEEPVPPVRALSYSEEFDRAELVERMLTECRGISYNALELAQSSGEALWYPAPTQLVVVRVRHPYCAELLRAYAPKTSV